MATVNGDEHDACSLCDIVDDQQNLQYKIDVPTCFSCIGIEEQEQSQQTNVSSITSTVIQLQEQPIIRQNISDRVVKEHIPHLVKIKALLTVRDTKSQSNKQSTIDNYNITITGPKQTKKIHQTIQNDSILPTNIKMGEFRQKRNQNEKMGRRHKNTRKKFV
ncbi:unnamed protein product [Mytilus coruscus]|uniref:Uncharacterized protein n=1 Tax=Mytilus coruscus TaxID=42192 RepID=A0A6J8EVQ8_MYTCO|nr:unnamed protein product [Mytilus coruscus]